MPNSPTFLKRVETAVERLDRFTLDPEIWCEACEFGMYFNQDSRFRPDKG